MTIKEFQKLISDLYFTKDSARGVDGTFLWFAEEVGELARAIRSGGDVAMEAEFADVMAWLVSLGNLCGIDVEKVVAEKYGSGCPKCGQTPCGCG